MPAVDIDQTDLTAEDPDESPDERPGENDLDEDERAELRYLTDEERAATPKRREWVKVQIRTENYERLLAWWAAVYPRKDGRPATREAADRLMAAQLDTAEETIKPRPEPLDELDKLRSKKS